MKVCFGTILLNESQYLELSFRQHLPYCDRWVLVEGADRLYPKERVTKDGLSTDNSAEIIRSFQGAAGACYGKVQLIQHGWAKNKQELRNRYAELADDYDALVVIDVDEFLSEGSMAFLLGALGTMKKPGAVRLPHVHLWKDHEHIITGGYWDVPHDRAYRWARGARYVRDHNHPQIKGRLLRQLGLHDRQRQLYYPQSQPASLKHDEPFWLHFGNCKAPDAIKDKNEYYVSRGEATTRPKTVASRAAWFGDLPDYCRVHNWCGPFPEVFK